MFRPFDLFVVGVAVLTLAAFLLSLRRSLRPAMRGWQIGILFMVTSQLLPAVARVLGLSPSVRKAAALAGLACTFVALWMMWRHRGAIIGVRS